MKTASDPARSRRPDRPTTGPRDVGALLLLGTVRAMGRLAMVAVAIGGCASAGPAVRTFPVTVEVDFGPADRPAVQRIVEAGRGATADQVTAQACAVERGAVCCDAHEIAGIDGVMSDPAANRWWVLSINGSRNVSPFRTKLRPADRVRWEYRQYEQ